jgi:hypothetical protein
MISTEHLQPSTFNFQLATKSREQGRGGFGMAGGMQQENIQHSTPNTEERGENRNGVRAASV